MSLSRRDFVRAGLVAAAAGLLPGCQQASVDDASDPGPRFAPGGPLPWRNWGGNQAFVPTARWAPESEPDLLERLAATRTPVRPVGAGHSFSALVPGPGALVATDLLSGLAASDAQSLEAEVWSGTRLHRLGPLLEAAGQALPNQPDIDYQTLGGALATSTHGTGPRFGSLSAYVTGLTLATPAGERVECSARRNAALYHAARCSLGALGVVTRVRLRNQPAVRLVERSRFEPVEDVLDEVEARRDAHRNFEFHAFPNASLAMTVTTDEAPGSETRLAEHDPEALYTLRDLYRAVGRLPGVGGALYDRLLRLNVRDLETRRVGPSYRVLAHPRLVRFREMEYTVPAEAGPACLREILRTIRERRIPVVFPIEYRYVRRDDVWLSMFHERDGCTISIHQFADRDHRAYFAEVEPVFWRYEGRPHWGKLHSLDAGRLAALYPRWQDFQEVRRGLDPAGRFLNDHLRRVLST